MIESQVLATNINGGIQSLSDSRIGSGVYVFRLYNEIGEFERAVSDPNRKKLPIPIINGVIQSLPSQVVPLQGVESYTLSQLVTYYVPVENTAAQDGTGSRLTVNAVLEVIRAWISKNAGAGGTMKGVDGGGDETFVMTTQLPSVGAESHILGDWYVPISFSVTWQFISGGVVGNNVSLEIGTRVSSSGKINYQRVLLLDGGISRERVLDSTPRDGSIEVKSVVTQEILTLKLVTPYLKGSPASTLVADALQSGVETKYYIKYADGAAFTDDNPFEAMMIARDVSWSFPPGAVSSVSATLVVADDLIYGE